MEAHACFGSDRVFIVKALTLEGADCAVLRPLYVIGGNDTC